jgi:putative (di)nucleoside polyphosphate hydrolase
MPVYRPNVAFILRNSAGEILVCERADWAGCWQFPQGGVKPGESWEQALQREVDEELGLPPAAYRVVEQRGPYRYLFDAGRKKSGYDGQEQQYFLGELTAADFAIRLDGAGEFRAVRWIRPAAFRLDWLPAMKHAVYVRVWEDFFGCAPGGITALR